MATCKECKNPVYHPHFIAIAVDSTNLGGGIKTFAVCEACVDANLAFYGDYVTPPEPPAPANEYRAQAGIAEGTGTP